MTSLSLYQVSQDYKAAEQRLYELDLPEEVVQDTLEGLAGDVEAKAINVGFFIRNLETYADAKEAAAKEMLASAKAIKNRIDRLKDYLQDNLVRTGISKVESPYFTIELQNNPPAVAVLDESLIPRDYWKQPEPPPPSLDKNLIKQAIKDGHTVPGVELKQSQRVSIK